MGRLGFLNPEWWAWLRARLGACASRLGKGVRARRRSVPRCTSLSRTLEAAITWPASSTRRAPATIRLAERLGGWLEQEMAESGTRSCSSSGSGAPLLPDPSSPRTRLRARTRRAHSARRGRAAR